MSSNDARMTSRNSMTSLSSLKFQSTSQTLPKSTRRASTSSTGQKRNFYMAHLRHQDRSVNKDDFFCRTSLSSLSAPLLLDTMNTFFRSTQTMEEDIMLPSKLKDMPVEETVSDQSVQSDNWYEIFTFIRNMRNQLQSTHPFAEDKDDTKTVDSNKPERKDSTDDEGILSSNHDNNNNSSASSGISSASSVISSEESEPSATSSVTPSCETIKDELKRHYYGLFRVLDTLSSIADRVTEKYREETRF